MSRPRTIWTLLLLIFAFAAVSRPAEATPIRLDLKKVLAQPQPEPPAFIPARAGWDGPETPAADVANAYTLHYGPQASANALRQSLIAAAVPDWRAVVAIVVMIFVLRRVRKATSDRAETSYEQPTDLARVA